jgi:hypothetical protein
MDLKKKINSNNKNPKIHDDQKRKDEKKTLGTQL